MNKAKNYWWKTIINKKSYNYKTKTLNLIFKPVTAYDPNDYTQFIFVGWIGLVINNKFVWFKRQSGLEWYSFGWNIIFKKNWKYLGPKKHEYMFDSLYYLQFNLLTRTVTVKQRIFR